MNFRDFKYAIRHVIRYKVYSLLNIIGLTLGMTSALLIMLWIDHEVRTDKFHANVNDIYTLYSSFDFSDVELDIDNSIPGPLAPAIEEELPEIVSAVRVTYKNKVLFRLGDLKFNEEGHFADSSFFKVFSFPFLFGDSATALNDPNSVVISERLSGKLFGTTNTVGNTIRIRENKEEQYTITGVFKDIPSYSSLKFDFILPFSKYLTYHDDNIHWGNYNIRTYLLAQTNINTEDIDQKVTSTYRSHFDWKLPEFFVQPFKETYLQDTYNGSKDNPVGLMFYVRLFSIIAFFIIFLACMNYTNLATAIATNRGREVGVKKVFGSGKKFIIRQFTAEAVALSFTSFVISLVLVQFILPYFNQLIESHLVLKWNSIRIIAIATGVLLITSILAGTFPALYMSALKPITVLRKSSDRKKGIPLLRQSLVVFQFIIIITFIISSILVFKQFSYIQNKELGLNKNNIVFFSQSLEIMQHRESFRAELEKQPGVLAVSYNNYSPLMVNNGTTDPAWRGKPDDFIITISNISTDYNFCETFGVEVIAGRNFDKTIASDTNALLINQTFASVMGMDNPVGEIIEYWGRKSKVIGVVKDFHINSIRYPIKQLMIINRPQNTWLTMVHIEGSMMEQALINIKRVLTEFDNSVPFEFQFIDEDYARNYKNEKKLSRISLIFTLLSVLISCLGLFGLALFTAQQRIKEIGVRKSLGARTTQIMLLITRGFLQWIILSFLIASTIAYVAMNNWLESYAYHINLSIWIFIATGAAILWIALLTVGWQSWRAASRNPVEALRYE